MEQRYSSLEVSKVPKFNPPWEGLPIGPSRRRPVSLPIVLYVPDLKNWFRTKRGRGWINKISGKIIDLAETTDLTISAGPGGMLIIEKGAPPVSLLPEVVSWVDSDVEEYFKAEVFHAVLDQMYSNLAAKGPAGVYSWDLDEFGWCWVVARGVNQMDKESREEVFGEAWGKAVDEQWGPTFQRAKELLVSEEIIEKAFGGE